MRGRALTILLLVACSKREAPPPSLGEHLPAPPPAPPVAVTAEERFPAEPPVLEVETSGGIAGTSQGERVWRDGTIRYVGSECRSGSGARGQLPRESVEALLRELESGGFFAYTHDATKYPPCPDSFGDTITVRSGGREHTISYDRCSRPELERFGRRLTAVLGKNPC